MPGLASLVGHVLSDPCPFWAVEAVAGVRQAQCGMATTAGRTDRLRVMVVDDDEDLRELLRLVLEGSERFEIVGEASDAATALELAPRHRPDAVVLDLGLPGLSGLQVLPELRRLVPAARVVVFSGQGDAAAKRAALAEGAASYVLKDGDVRPLMVALQVASTGRLAEATTSLVADPTACRVARRFVSHTCEEWECDELTEVAQLVTSELVGNLVVHARTSGELTLRLWADAMRVEVTDRGPATPSPREADATSESGRGLMIVAAVSVAWGVAPAPDGKTVWADVARAAHP